MGPFFYQKAFSLDAEDEGWWCRAKLYHLVCIQLPISSFCHIVLLFGLWPFQGIFFWL